MRKSRLFKSSHGWPFLSHFHVLKTFRFSDIRARTTMYHDGFEKNENGSLQTPQASTNPTQSVDPGTLFRNIRKLRCQLWVIGIIGILLDMAKNRFVALYFNWEGLVWCKNTPTGLWERFAHHFENSPKSEN